jgi:hypothetical protein
MSHSEPVRRASIGAQDGRGSVTTSSGGIQTGRDLDRLIRLCRERGWASVVVAGEPPRPCRPDEPAAGVDLDRAVFWLEHGDLALHGHDVPGLG